MQLLIAHSNVLYASALSSTFVDLDMIDSVHTLNSTSAQEILQETRRLCPAILIVPYAPADLGGVVTRQMNSVRPGTQVIVIDVTDDDAAVIRLIELGVAGYQVVGAPIESLIDNVGAVARGETQCSPRIARRLFSLVARRGTSLNDSAHSIGEHRLTSRNTAHLTRREIEIVELIERGMANKEIARSLGIEVQTVKNHVHNVLQKLQVRDRRGAVRYAKQHGLLTERGTPVLLGASHCLD